MELNPELLNVAFERFVEGMGRPPEKVELFTIAEALAMGATVTFFKIEGVPIIKLELPKFSDSHERH